MQGFCGTLSLEPLVSDRPGPPVYLSQTLTAQQRAAYAKELSTLRSRAESLLPEIPQKHKMMTIIRCIENVQGDLAADRRQKLNAEAQRRKGNP